MGQAPGVLWQIVNDFIQEGIVVYSFLSLINSQFLFLLNWSEVLITLEAEGIVSRETSECLVLPNFIDGGELVA
jgi:hypothetical protein